MPLTEEEKRRREEERRRKQLDKGRDIAVVEKEGKQFVLPKREAPELRVVQEREREQQAIEVETIAGEKEAAAREPERVELDIEREGAAKAPVVGAGAKVLADTLFRGAMESLPEGIEKEAYRKIVGVKPLIQNPETARQVYLQEIQKQVIKEGITESEKFGVLIEAIPFVGSAVAKYAGALIETPGGNAAIVMNNILNEKERALNTAEMVRSGRLPVDAALIRLEGIEDNIVRLEQRIKLLALSSATLVAEGDTLNRWETEILRTRERVEDARTSALNKRRGMIEPETSIPLIDGGLRAGESVW